MKKLILAGLSAGLLTLLADPAMAHGGQYRGPGDVVPPAPGGGGGGRSPGTAGPTTGGPAGPTTPSPTGPTTPGPTGPGTGGPAGPGNPKGPTTPGGGIVLDDDLTRWEFWWEFNKDPYIRLKDAIHSEVVTSGSDEFFLGAGRTPDAGDTLKPSETEILSTILPKLKQAMETTTNRDITSSCLIAMAKVGKNKPGEIDIIELMKGKLTDNNQEIRETAALSMGISAMTEAVDDLVELASDSAKGRALIGGGSVDDRTRTFAIYGLGLVAHASNDLEIKTKALATLAKYLEDRSFGSRNIRVALVNAIAMLNPDVFDQGDLAQACLKALEDYYTKPLGTGELLMQSHCPPAAAKILGKSGPEGEDSWWQAERTKWKDMLMMDLMGRTRTRDSNEIAMSAALTLGQLCGPVDDPRTSPDAKYARVLWDYFTGSSKDAQAKLFCLMAMGQMGGDWNKNQLVGVLRKGTKFSERPWAALALGVYTFNRYEAAAKSGAGAGGTVDVQLGMWLEEQLKEASAPDAAGAFAVALGLCKYKDAADLMRETLVKKAHQESFAGYLCIGLALMDDQRSKEDIRKIVADSVRRPDLLKQAAIALGKLGDKEVAKQLQDLMREDGSEPNLAKMSAIASALGFIGDRRSIDPLVDMLFDDDLTDLSRAFAAVALGGVADKEPLPWNSKIGTNMNYRASVETLTNGQNGILDIL